ncbi:MAG: hypothetical protein KKG14_03705 [Alphaproteobacteria bacterium]|nr:hypothetical protein [Alphaproteobacteria bacterium]MBU2270194.1 hypothetical protein [Alphaproteobacteria bacterium]MBU2417787.1 hypothetical protein [Alphaproteobacteria bacterium]
MTTYRAPTFREETAALDDDAVFDMANLAEAQTGIAGVVTITTDVGWHGPKVRYARGLRPPGPGFSVSIGPDPVIIFGDMPAADRADIAEEVIEWVTLNHEALIKFWRDGAWWMMGDVQDFIAGLEKV